MNSKMENQNLKIFPPWPSFGDDEIEAVERVLRSGQVNYWTGQEGRKFEEEYAASVGAKYAVALMNGSVALEAGVGRSGDGAGR
jgi:dTDP-4-amino-4,6-dideoxygalactose transaminase